MTAPAPDGAKTILMIEDDASLHKVVRLRLEREGYRMISATDGAQGLAMLESERPDLILLDLLMPGVDGHEVMKALKANPQTKHIPVILLTVLGKDEGIDAYMRAGNVYHFSKPYRAPELLGKIKDILTAPARSL